MTADPTETKPEQWIFAKPVAAVIIILVLPALGLIIGLYLLWKEVCGE